MNDTEELELLSLNNTILAKENDALKEQVAQLKLIEEQALKVCTELDAVAMAIPDCRYMDLPDGGNVSLEEQVGRMWQDVQKWKLATSKNADCIRDQQETIAQLRDQIRDMANDLSSTGDTIAQQAEALHVKDEALLAYPVRGEYFLEHLDATWMWDKALAIQPSPDILLERDARLVERINRHLLDIGDNCSDDPLQHIANQIRNGEINV